MKTAHIIGGGTIAHVRPHLAISAPAYGTTARQLEEICKTHERPIKLHLTKMANQGRGNLETNDDINNLLNDLIEDPNTGIIFFNPALVDYSAFVLENGKPTLSGKYLERLSSRTKQPRLQLVSNPKLIGKIRENRKDIYLVAFKTTCGASEDEQYAKGLNLLKENSCNLVLANDVKTRTNMIITPEEARYHVTTDRHEALTNLVDMAYLRSNLHYTRTNVVPGPSIPWDSQEIPHTLRQVVNHCIQQGAYKPFRGSTVGHFSFKQSDTTFLISKRKTNYNNLEQEGLVRITIDGPLVIAYGAKPSAGSITQRKIFQDHPEYDCIVHFHCPPKSTSHVPAASQREYECGSHECGKNTSNGLQKFGNLSAVYLDNHGPNIVFNHKTDPQEIITFIDQNFDLAKKTGGMLYEKN